MDVVEKAYQREADDEEEKAADRKPFGAAFLLPRIVHITNDTHEHRPWGQ